MEGHTLFDQTDAIKRIDVYINRLKRLQKLLKEEKVKGCIDSFSGVVKITVNEKICGSMEDNDYLFCIPENEFMRETKVYN